MRHRRDPLGRRRPDLRPKDPVRAPRERLDGARFTRLLMSFSTRGGKRVLAEVRGDWLIDLATSAEQSMPRWRVNLVYVVAMTSVYFGYILAAAPIVGRLLERKTPAKK